MNEMKGFGCCSGQVRFQEFKSFFPAHFLLRDQAQFYRPISLAALACIVITYEHLTICRQMKMACSFMDLHGRGRKWSRFAKILILEAGVRRFIGIERSYGV